MPANPLGRIANPQLTREIVESVLVQPLMQQNTFLAAGPQIHDSDGSQVRLPKLTGTSPPGMHGENELITTADADFGSVILLPPQLKSVKVLVKLSNEILRQSVVSLEAVLRDRLVYDVTKVLDFYFFQGDGSADGNGNTVPKGMANWTAADEVQTVTVGATGAAGSFTLTFQNQTTAPIAFDATAAEVRAALEALDAVAVGDVTTVGDLPSCAVTFAGNYAATSLRLMTAASSVTDAGGGPVEVTVARTTAGADGAQVVDNSSATPDLDDLHDMIGMALGAYASPNRWFMTPRVFTFIRKLKDEYGRYQLQPDPKAENQFQLFGIPVSVTNHMAPGGALTGVSTIALTDMAQIAVGRDLDASVRILDQTFGDYDQTAIRVVTRYDVAPLNGRATVLLTNVAAA